MKTNILMLAWLQWCTHLLQAAVIHPPIHQGETAHSGLHFSYSSLVDGKPMIIQVLEPGYSGEVVHSTAISTYVPKKRFATSKELALRDSDMVVRRDICFRIAECAGALTDAAAFYGLKGLNGLANTCLSLGNAVNNYYTANNYAHLSAVFDGLTSTVVFAIPLGVISYYFNIQLGKLSGGTSSDACGVTQPAVVAETTADAVYQFCTSIQNEYMSAAATRFSTADLANSDDENDLNTSDGNVLFVEVNLSTIAGQAAALCSAQGITWKRDLGSALLRGKERLGQ